MGLLVRGNINAIGEIERSWPVPGAEEADEFSRRRPVRSLVDLQRIDRYLFGESDLE
jgi:hypothetical protein